MNAPGGPASGDGLRKQTLSGTMPARLHYRAIRHRALPRAARPLLLAAALHCLTLRRMEAEDRVDFKFLYYGEENDRTVVWGPSFIAETDLDSRFQLKIEGIYDVISGASPTGAPAPSQIRLGPGMNSQSYSLTSGPTQQAGPGPAATGGPQPPRPPSTDTTLPTQQFHDARLGLNAELRFRTGDWLITGQVAYSTEADYNSIATTLKVARDLNQKNTTITGGVSYNHDDVDVVRPISASEEKEGVQLLLGVTQVLDPKTVLSANFVAGFASGFLSDQYKSALVGGSLLPDKRPDDKDHQILFTTITRSFDSLHGSAEASYRFYRDSFGVSAHTAALAWYQKIGGSFVLRPSVRYHQQDAADFYGVQFPGTPEFYSADYRLSNCASLSYGMKVVWTPKERFSADIGYERYEMWGRDGITSDQAYPSANIVTLGLHFYF